MNATDGIFRRALGKLLTEILNGPPGNEAYVLNPGDGGLIGQLKSISAATASKRPMAGKTTIASHVDHVLYGLTLLNRWAAGEENPWAEADWGASWKRASVTAANWRKLQADLRKAVIAWKKAVKTREDWNEMTACGALASAVHTAYHLGAIRQIVAASSKAG